MANTFYDGRSDQAKRAAVTADNTGNGAAVWATARPEGRAVVGLSDTGAGVWGQVKAGRAIVGAVDTEGTGVWGEAQSGRAVVGVAHQTGAGVWGESPAGDGVVGKGRRGVVGDSETFQGVFGHSGDNAGVVGVSERMHGVFAESHSATSAGLFAHNTAGGDAGAFEGPVVVTGDLTLHGDLFCPGADYAEQMPTAPGVQPGDCVVLDDDARVVPCGRDYDRRVVGVISGAGGLRPAFVLDRETEGAPIALVGKAFVRVDAERGAVRIGDLLTTSTTPGHAMRVEESDRAAHAVIGRALQQLSTGRGLVKILISGR